MKSDLLWWRENTEREKESVKRGKQREGQQNEKLSREMGGKGKG